MGGAGASDRRWGSGPVAIALVVAGLLLTACDGAGDVRAAGDVPPADAATVLTTTSTSTTSATSATSATSTTSTTVPGRAVTDTAYSAFSTFGGVTLVHPSAVVERIGFHESGHDGARQLETVTGAVRPVVLASRNRGTGSRTAADIVVPPDTEIRSPVSGTVVRAGTYRLYCDHHDDYAVISPDARPGWEVKVFHIDGVLVRAGDRVVAGVTTLAPRATILPFDSQVDEWTATPAWPHVHVEMVDPSIPDRPGTTGGC